MRTPSLSTFFMFTQFLAKSMANNRLVPLWDWSPRNPGSATVDLMFLEIVPEFVQTFNLQNKTWYLVGLNDGMSL